MHPAVVLGGLASLVVILGGIGTWWVKVGRERWDGVKSFVAKWVETVVGRPAEHDAYGREIAAEIPPLVEQQAVTQRLVGELTGAVSTLVEHVDEISSVKQRLDVVERDVEGLKRAGLERTLTKAEAIAAWRAIEAAQGSTPPPTELEQPDL